MLGCRNLHNILPHIREDLLLFRIGQCLYETILSNIPAKYETVCSWIAAIAHPTNSSSSTAPSALVSAESKAMSTLERHVNKDEECEVDRRDKILRLLFGEASDF